MNDRKLDSGLDDELDAFFRRVPPPEPSDRLRERVRATRHEAAALALRRPEPRRRILFSLAGLAAAFVLGAGLLAVVANRAPGPGPASAPASGGSPTPGVSWKDAATPGTGEQILVSSGDRLFAIYTGPIIGGLPVPTGGVWESRDATTWTKIAEADAIRVPIGRTRSIFAAGPDGRGGLVAVGGAEAGGADGETAAWHSPDGRTWSPSKVEGPAGRMLAVAARPDLLVAIGITFDGGPGAWRSTDAGATWTFVQLPGDAMEARGVVADGDRFIVVGSSPTRDAILLWSSTNGVTWQVASSPSDASFAAHSVLAWAGHVVVLGSGLPGEEIRTCDAGLRCSPASVPNVGFASISMVGPAVVANGLFVANVEWGVAGTGAIPSASEYRGGIALWVSRDGEHWSTLPSQPKMVYVTSLEFFGGRLVGLGVMDDDLYRIACPAIEESSSMPPPDSSACTRTVQLLTGQLH